MSKEEAIQKVFEYLNSLSKEEFQQLLGKYEEKYMIETETPYWKDFYQDE